MNKPEIINDYLEQLKDIICSGCFGVCKGKICIEHMMAIAINMTDQVIGDEKSD